MIAKYLAGNISILDKTGSWDESIVLASQVLLDKKIIKESYVQAMIDNVNKNGSYMVIVPQIALAHAREDKGVLKTGLSLLKLNRPVMFPEEKLVSVIMVLAAKEEKNHLELMSELADIFIDDKKVKNISLSSSIEIIQEQFR
ncbi:PTS sugar transporter subunit IIA [Pectinatus frisingensis]|uniref:PTS sugar transporter subunit IIA n=1 Tax=Pectinatus frisingensis TaxID=865 RepID=UPI0018C84EF8|nr:PTS sugar transporter subunit IIA [Pectinatus frisingensis]